MDDVHAPAETCVDRDLYWRQELRSGRVRDPETGLFLILLDALPEFLSTTPYLWAVGWRAGRFDLLFTDGNGTWCAVEVKEATEIRFTGRRRRNLKTKAKRRYIELMCQADSALDACRELFVGAVRALGLWREDGAWVVAADVGG